MTNRERTMAILNYRSCDRMPVVHFGYWRELLDEWALAGHVTAEEAGAWGDGNEVDLAIAARLGFDYGHVGGIGADSFLRPAFEREVIAEFPDGSRHVRNHDGVTELVVPGANSIPAEIEHLLTDRASWEEHYLPRLKWCEERLPGAAELARIVAEAARRQDRPLILGGGSVIGWIRNWLGVIGMSYLECDDPELLHEIVVTVAELSYRGIAALFEAGCRPDMIHYWEDICYNHGPLVTPEFFRREAVPCCRRVADLARQYGCELVSVDCDGKIDELVGLWLEGGVNVMFPIEVGTWDPDFAAWRRKYGRELRGIGGMNKLVLGRDRAAVDREIERLKPLVGLGGFIPCPDHRLPPGTRWELVQYYTERMREVF